MAARAATPLAHDVGIDLYRRMRNPACFFERLNFVKVLQLPVVFVCGNNGYGGHTPFEAVTPSGIVPHELDRCRERDPLAVAAASLRDGGVRCEEIEADVEIALGRIEQAALAAPFPRRARAAGVRPRESTILAH